MFDYDKLFAEGNIIGLRNKELDYIFVHRIYSKDIQKVLKDEDTAFVNWDNYKNERLAIFDMEIAWIATYDENYCSFEVIFNREKDMPKELPEIKDGMFVHITDGEDYDSGLGVVVGDKIVYQDGGFDMVDTVLGNTFFYIDKIWNCKYGFDYVGDGNLIWSKN